MITVRSGTAADAGVASALHAGQISEGFLSFLGPSFLRRLYRRITLTPHSFLLIAESEGVPVGFIAGSTDVPGLYKSFVWHDGVAAAAGAAVRLIAGWRKALETLRHGSGGGEGAARGGELLAVAVDPAWQGRGAGRMLVASFLDEMEIRGYEAASVVVGTDNGGAVALYQGAGFLPVRRFELHPGVQSLLMRWDRPAASPDPSTGPA